MIEADRETKSIIETTAESFGRDMAEARSLGQVDNVDTDVETLFDQGKRTEDSPGFLAVWGKEFPLADFTPQASAPKASAQANMSKCLEVIRQHLGARTMYDEAGKIRNEVITDLAAAGYWGMLIDETYGGSGLSFTQFSRFLAEVATVEPTIAGLASVHGCIGAVDPVSSFGTEALKRKYLPLLASGQRLSAFALTEPNAGSDLTAIRTTAHLDGESYVVNGKKLFITNAGYGRTVGLVCDIEGKKSVLIVDLPDQETPEFRIEHYGLWALAHANNVGLEFKGFRVPKENLLQGKGLMIAYRGLNKGRVALCANAAGTMRSLLANMLPWAQYRVTYTKAIGERELVQRRVGEMLGLIVGCDALTDWCAGLLDKGFRGEMECIIAKRFGSESLKHAAIEYVMKTHGGRSFLHGHMFGDNIHDFLAPCIYEGEGEMLSMAFFKALTKQHGEELFLPIAHGVGKHKNAGRMKDFNPANPIHAWLMRKELLNYTKWFIGDATRSKGIPSLSGIHHSLREDTEFAIRELRHMPRRISLTMVKHQVALIDRQCRMAFLSQQVQDLIVMVSASSWASQQQDEVTIRGAQVLLQNLKMKYTGSLPTDAYFRLVTKLGKAVLRGDYQRLTDLNAGQILWEYPKGDN